PRPGNGSPLSHRGVSRGLVESTLHLDNREIAGVRLHRRREAAKAYTNIGRTGFDGKSQMILRYLARIRHPTESPSDKGRLTRFDTAQTLPVGPLSMRHPLNARE